MPRFRVQEVSRSRDIYLVVVQPHLQFRRQPGTIVVPLKQQHNYFSSACR